MERESPTFFDIGSISIKPEAQKMFAYLAHELGRLSNRITIEGHTDSRPYGTQAYTNWELSTDRAHAVRRLMEASGLKPSQLYAVRGFADRQLRRPEDPLDYQNRRVSIIVMLPPPHDPDLRLQITPPSPGPEPAPSGAYESDGRLPPALQEALKSFQPGSRLGW